MKNIERFKDDLKRHEGVVLQVYPDSVGLPTVGVGHLVRPEDNLQIGQNITPEQCEALLEKDTTSAIQGCEQMFLDFNDMGEELQLILANMMFNLGPERLAGFKKFLAAVKERDYQRAADEMMDSQWYHQVKERSKELVARMRALA
jgi:lysozyme